jgi:hypothetical protein
MRMSESLTCLLLICGLFIAAPAQKRKARRPACADARLSKQHPSVYITFERAGRIASPANGAIEERVWLRLHNNTRWAIWHDAQGLPKEYGDVGLFYDVENLEDHKVEVGNSCHVCSFIPLAPGRSAIFSIPREDIPENHRIRVSFWYEWQDSNDVAGGREVQNWVYFYGSDLPKAAR